MNTEDFITQHTIELEGDGRCLEVMSIANVRTLLNTLIPTQSLQNTANKKSSDAAGVFAYLPNEKVSEGLYKLLQNPTLLYEVEVYLDHIPKWGWDCIAITENYYIEVGDLDDFSRDLEEIPYQQFITLLKGVTNEI